MQKEEKLLKDYMGENQTTKSGESHSVVDILSRYNPEDLTRSIKNLSSTISGASSNLIISLGCQTQSLKDGIDAQVSNLISSNKELGRSNDEYAAKTLKLTQVNIWLSVAIAVTAVIGLWNLVLTHQLKGEAIKANQIDEQPFLGFVDGDLPYIFRNSGKGVATNILLVVWDEPMKQLYVTGEGAVREVLGTGEQSSILQSELEKIEFTKVKESPWLVHLLERVNGEGFSWFALIYDDIYGNTYSTIIKGPRGNYSSVLEFIKLNHVQ